MSNQNDAADARLIESIRRGDRSAFDAFIETHWSRLLAYLRSRGAGSTAEDLAQEALLRVWERRETLDRGRSMAAYLYRTARNLATDRARRRDVHAAWVDRERAAGGRRVTDPVEEMVDRARVEAVARAIEALPARRREAFNLVHVQGLSYQEAADVMGNARQTVANQVAAALGTLRRELRHLVDPDTSPVEDSDDHP